MERDGYLFGGRGTEKRRRGTEEDGGTGSVCLRSPRCSVSSDSVALSPATSRQASNPRRNLRPFSASASCEGSNERQIAAARAIVFTLLVNDSMTTGPS